MLNSSTPPISKSIHSFIIIMSSLRNYILTLTIVTLLYCGNAQLTPNFYATTCPTLSVVVRAAMTVAVARETRMAASILRLHFHDCFVNGCDASILLDDVGTFVGEQNAFPNRGSVRGYEVIDTIKTLVEAVCPRTVSCADILTLAARDATILAGGPTWTVPLGRRDTRTASQSDANTNLPPPNADLASLIQFFSNQGLSERDMVALSGSHSIGFAQCSSFSTRIYNDTNINTAFAATRRATCPSAGGPTLAPLDTTTTNVFDNAYYTNLLTQRGLLHSDQALFSGGSADALVRQYSANGGLFRSDFAAAMVRMGNIRPLTGANGEIRRRCGVVN